MNIVSEALSKFDQVVANAPQYIKDFKAKTGKKVVGFLDTLAPAELVHAAGAHPMRMFPFSKEPVTVGDTYLQSFLCSYVRSTWDQALKGMYDYVDGVVIPTSCEVVRFLYQTWRRVNPCNWVVSVVIPFKKEDYVVNEFFIKELERLKAGLEKNLGTSITDDSLKKSLEVFNRNRDLMKKVYEMRKSESPPITGTEAFKMVFASMICDKDEHSSLVEKLIEEVRDRKAMPDAKVRLMLVGGCVSDPAVIEMIEDTGAIVVIDDLTVGTQYFWENADLFKPPMEALARRYLSLRHPANTSGEDRAKFIADMVKEYRVDGVVYVFTKYCESHRFDYPILETRLKEEKGISTTLIEVEHIVDLAPLRTRVEAFVESLK